MEEISINIKLMRTFRRLGSLIDAKATPFRGRGRIMNILRKEESKSIVQRDLLDMTQMKSSSLSELVKKLEDDGFITKSIDPSDKRNMILALTPKGEAEAFRMQQVREQIADKAFSRITNEEKNVLLEILTKLRDYWEENL